MSDANRLLDALAPGESVTFQTFADGAAQRGLTRVLHGTLAAHSATLTDLNARGAGVFWMVNAGDGKARKASNVMRVRALFVDLDGAPLEPVSTAWPAPHAIVESSPNRWHAYWCVTDCSIPDFKPLQQALARRFGSDPSVCDLPRVMRLPGFWHCKREPYRSRIVELRAGPPYSVAELRSELGLGLAPVSAETRQIAPKARRTVPASIPEGERNDTLFQLACGLVKGGHSEQEVNRRIQRINAERCDLPLCATEVDAIVANASRYGSDGFVRLPHELLDSRQWKALPPGAHDVLLLAFRRYNGSNNGNIALTWTDFEGREGFADRHTFYRYRDAAVRSGILILRTQGGNTRDGRRPDLFAIDPRWLKVPSVEIPHLRQCGNPNPYIDKQALAESGFEVRAAA